MVIKRDRITERLKELDTVIRELTRITELTPELLSANLAQRWIIERELIAAATLIFDIADHILVGEFFIHAKTYEDSLLQLHKQAVISDKLFEQLKGLGGFRNILVHMYQEIDPLQVWDSYQKGLVAFPTFIQEIFAWLDEH